MGDPAQTPTEVSPEPSQILNKDNWPTLRPILSLNHQYV